MPFVVRKVHKELPGIFTLEMAPPAGEFNFMPGQFNMLYVFGNGEVPISICGDPQRPGCLVHTVRAVGKVSAAICDLSRGEALGVRGPFGTSWPVQEIAGGDVVFITSGLGLAPLRPAIYHVLNHRDQYGKVTLLYGARTPDRL
ncbi:MAG: Ni/Fe hydrogenase subunit gamma, partial [Pseudomonadota bacterium]